MPSPWTDAGWRPTNSEPIKTSPCHNAPLWASKGDGVLMGTCAECNDTVVRINSKTNRQEITDAGVTWPLDHIKNLQLQAWNDCDGTLFEWLIYPPLFAVFAARSLCAAVSGYVENEEGRDQLRRIGDYLVRREEIVKAEARKAINAEASK